VRVREVGAGGRRPRPAGGDTFKGRAPPPFLLMITLLKKVAVKNGMPVLDISLKILKHVYAALPFLIKTK